MKILLVFPFPAGGYGINESTQQPPLGIAYLASVLEKSGYTVEVLDANSLNYSIDETLDVVERSRPDIVCLSLLAFNFRAGSQIAESVKKFIPEVLVIAGGAQPSALMEKTLDKSNSIDAVVFGEGESTLLEIAGRMNDNLNPFSDVDGVIYKKASEIIKNRPREPIKNLDELPFPAFHLFADLSLYHRRTLRFPAAPIMISRGCPFECIFCSKNVFGRQVRYRSAENVISEIDYLVERFQIKQLDIVDDNFTTCRERAIEVLESLCKRPYKLAINLQNGLSASLIDEDMLKLMKRAGVYRIAIGVESGNRDVRKVIKKKEHLDDIVNTICLMKKADIRADAFFMIGLPGDTPLSMQNTIDFAKQLDPQTANFHMVVPFPGTEMYNMIKKKGKFLKNTEDGIKSGYNYPEAFYEIGVLKKKDIERYYKKAYKEFYFRPKKVFETIINIKSLEEFNWLVKTGMRVILSLFKVKTKMDSLKFFLPNHQYYTEKWGDQELDLLSRLVYHPIYGLIYRCRYRKAYSLISGAGTCLEVGCGYGQFLPALSGKIDRLYAVDIHPYLGRVKRILEKERLEKVKLSRGNISHLPYKENSFNLIVCLSLLEHLGNPERAILELKRVLKKDGKLIVGFPVKNYITRIFFKLINRDDRVIHPQSHLSLLANIGAHFTMQRQIVFPKYLPAHLKFYFIGEFVKNDG